MRWGASVVIATSLFFISVGVGEGQSGLPDLAVKMIRVSPAELEEGQPAQLRAVIINQGQGDATGAFDIVLELNGREIATRSLFSLKKDQTSEISIPWQAVAGTHTLTVLVDAPFNSIRESSESNNKRSLSFTASPLAGVRSFSLDLVKTLGRSLDEAGQALHFQLTDNVLTSIDNAVRALNDTALALRNASVELGLVRHIVPRSFANHSHYSEADAVVALFEALAESFVRISGMLSIGNFDGVLENARILRQNLIKLSNQKLAGTSFEALQPAIAQFDQVIALATELRNLLKGAQGRSQYQVAVELFHALLGFGDQLCAAAQKVTQQAVHRSARFTNGSAVLNGAYNTKHVLNILWPGILLMRLELYELSTGALIYRSEELGPWLDWVANGLFSSSGAYGYKLVGISKQGVERVEIGRLYIKQTGSIPPLGKGNVPLGHPGDY